MDGESIGKLIVFIIFIAYYLFSQAKKAMSGKGKATSADGLMAQLRQLEQKAMAKQAKLLEKERRLERSNLPKKEKLSEKIKILEEKLRLEHETIAGQTRLLDQSSLPKQHIQPQKEKLQQEAGRVQKEFLLKKEDLQRQIEELQQEEIKRNQEKIQNPYEKQEPPQTIVQQVQPKFEPSVGSKSDAEKPALQSAKDSSATSVVKPVGKIKIGHLFRTKNDLSRAILMKEILGPPPSVE